MQPIFTDVIGNITFSAGVIRMDMLRIVGQDPETKQTRFEANGQLAMPLEGFLRSLAMQEKIRDQLIEQGVLAPNSAETQK